MVNTVFKKVPEIAIISKSEELVGLFCEQLDNTSDENSIMNKFLSNSIEYYGGEYKYDALSEVAFHTYDYTKSENCLDIGYWSVTGAGAFDNDAWANILSKTFPNLSFFLIGDCFSDYLKGFVWDIYKDGKFFSEEDRAYELDELNYPKSKTDCVFLKECCEATGEDDCCCSDYSEDGTLNCDGYWEWVSDEIEKYTTDLAQAALKVWKLEGSNEDVLKSAQDEAQVIREKLDNLVDRVFPKWD
jgi:hypothetical protein